MLDVIGAGEPGSDEWRLRSRDVPHAARAGAVSRWRDAVCCGYGQSPDSRDRSERADGEDRGGDGAAGAWSERWRRRVVDVAQLTVGSRDARAAAVHRDGGDASDLDARHDARLDLAVCRLWPRGARRWHGGRCGVRAAVGADDCGRDDDRGGQRIEHHPRDRAAAGESREHAGGRRPFRLRRQGWRRATRSASSIRWASRITTAWSTSPIPTTTASSGWIRARAASRRSRARAAPAIRTALRPRPSSTNLAASPSPAIGCMSLTPTITRSARSTSVTQQVTTLLKGSGPLGYACQTQPL